MCLLFHLSAKAFDSLCDYLNGTEPSSLTYEDLKIKLKNLFAPKAIEIAENFKFYNRKQTADEDISVFTNALNNLSLQCNFSEFKEKALLNQFVVGVRDPRLQRGLLETANLTYDKVVQAATAMELTDKEASTITQNKNATIHALHTDKRNSSKYMKNKNKNNKLSQQKNENTKYEFPSKKVKCYRCAKIDHKSNVCRVDSQTLSRNSCHKRGHVVDACLNNRANTYHVDEYDNNSESNGELLDFHLVDCVNQLEQFEDREKFLKLLKVNGQDVTFEIDS